MPHDTFNLSARVADYPVASQFLERWSPRAFTGDPISRPELFGGIALRIPSPLRLVRSLLTVSDAARRYRLARAPRHLEGHRP
jgi:hypothetical protein